MTDTDEWPPEYWAKRFGVPVDHVRVTEEQTGKSFGDLTRDDFDRLIQAGEAEVARTRAEIVTLEHLKGGLHE